MAPINNISFPQGHQPERTGQTEAVEQSKVESRRQTSEAVPGQDQATISAEAHQLAGLRATLEQVPEIRHDRVDSLRRALQEGAYEVSDEQIAEALLRDLSGNGSV